MSPYLKRPLRTEEQIMFERADRHHRDTLAELLQWMKQDHLQAMNAPGPDRWYNHRATRISAVKYAIEQLTQAAAERIKAANREDVG